MLASLALAGLLAFHQLVPDVLGLGLVLDNLAPWLGLAIPFLALLTLGAGGRGPWTVLLVPILVWAVSFGPQAVPAARPTANLSVATMNSHGDPQLLDADVVALQELAEGQANAMTAQFRATHPYHYTLSTVGVWSKYRLVHAESLNLGLKWARALRTDVETESGTVRLYTVHAASARPLQHAERDQMLRNLAGYVEKDSSQRIVVAGDFNATSSDRHFAPVAQQLDEAKNEGWGLAMTWPRRPFGMLGIDHVMTRGVDKATVQKLEAGDSDHFALRASIKF